MRTAPCDENLVKIFGEGKKWLRRKYGFDSRWMMQMYTKFLYEKFSNAILNSKSSKYSSAICDPLCKLRYRLLRIRVLER